jgi:hypothetical protein
MMIACYCGKFLSPSLLFTAKNLFGCKLIHLTLIVRRVLPYLMSLNISHLCTYSKEEHGHCEVTVRKGFDELKPLASWASTQRVSEMSSSNLLEMTFPNFTSNPTHGFLHMFAVHRNAVKIQGETIGHPAGENNRYLLLFTCLHFFTNFLSTLMFVFTTPFVLDITDEQIMRL